MPILTTGSLGISISAANGMALGAKIQGRDYKVFCMIGDGEINEGQIWEAAATAANFKLDNIIVFVDLNGLQNDGKTVDVKDMKDICEKWGALCGSDMVPVRPSHIWMDRRAEEESKWISEHIGAKKIFDMSGNGIDSYFGYTKLVWVQNHELK